jgi:hypothetical protein
MSKIAISPGATGNAVFTIQAPSTETSRTLNLPDNSGTVLTSASNLVGVTGVGKVLQVVNAISSTYFTTTSGSFVDVGFSASITPTSASSKVLVVVHANGLMKFTGNASNAVNIRVANGAGVKVQDIANGVGWNNVGSYAYGSASVSFLHEPNTTSSYTYKLQIMSWISGQTAAFNWYNDTQQTTSTITLMEIAS